MQLLSTLLLTTSAFVASYDIIDDPRTSLNFLRVRRKNSGFFEETRDDNFERECNEEMCSKEELREIHPDDADKVESQWKSFTAKCYIEKCGAEGTEVCIQTWNNRQCKCKAGFTNTDAADDCTTDVDECADTENPVCLDGQACQNNHGSYSCGCPNGFSDTDDGCVDNDECLDSPCPADEVCVNTDGAFDCNCQDGYFRGEDGTCVDLDECADTSACQAADPAHTLACHNHEGGFSCVCDTVGYTDIDGQCVDIDECIEDQCDHGTCRNKPGSFECDCESGWQGIFCEVDIDECADERSSPCNEDEYCANSQGSFSCHAKCDCGAGQECDAGDGSCFCTDEGYESTPVDGVCVDIDECVSDPCEVGQNCVNTQGGYECEDAITVAPGPDPTEPSTEPVPTVDPKDAERPEGDCGAGFFMSEHGVCEDIDECQTNNGDCPVMCMNFYGNHMCYDELNQEASMCHHFHVANDSMSGYSCDCYEGYHLCYDLFTCVSDNGYNEYNDFGQFKYASSPSDASADCADGQIVVEGGCYSVSSEAASYDGAVQACEDAGGALATIDGRALWWALGNNVDHGVSSFWIGPDSDANIYVFGDSGNLLANIARNMAQVPPQFNRVDDGEYQYICEF